MGSFFEEPLVCSGCEHLPLGVDVVVAEELARTEVDYGDLELVAFRTSWLRSPLRSTVHDAVAWPALDEVLSYDLLPADVPIAWQQSVLGG